jgi:hypothetical protein
MNDEALCYSRPSLASSTDSFERARICGPLKKSTKGAWRGMVCQQAALATVQQRIHDAEHGAEQAGERRGPLVA